jgi:hypothetical protein
MFQIKSESYTEVKEDLSHLLAQIKEIKSINIDNKDFRVEFYGGGDMKWNLNVFGLNGANSDYACFYCKCNFKDALDFDKKYKIDRTLSESEKLNKLNTKDEKKGYVRQPIIDFIEHYRVVYDTLHKNIRIIEKLLEVLMMKINEKDNRNDSMKLEDRPNLKIFHTFLETKCRISNPMNFNSEKKTIELSDFDAKTKMKVLQRFYDLDETDKANFEKEKLEKSDLTKLFPEINLVLENKVFRQYLFLHLQLIIP